MGLQLAARAQKYQMDVEVKGGLITSYVVNDLQDVVWDDDLALFRGIVQLELMPG
jgi:hypothetical protein